MGCETCRQALSARMDGEAEPGPPGAADEHLASCEDCRSWRQRAGALNRTLRLRPAHPVPDLAPRVLAQVALPRRRGLRWRLALGAVALAQLVLSVAEMAGWHATGHAVAGGMGAHLFNESSSWNLALAVGLGWVAWRSGAAGGLLPVFGGFLALLSVYCVHDLVVGDATALRVASHGLLLIGFVLMMVVDRRFRPGRPSRRAGPPGEATADPDGGEPATADPDPGQGTGRYRLRPVNRRDAA